MNKRAARTKTVATQKESRRVTASSEVELAAFRYVKSQEARADVSGPFPLWHGWALREAFIRGMQWGVTSVPDASKRSTASGKQKKP